MTLYEFENSFDVSKEEENDYVFNKFVVKKKDDQWTLIDIYGNTLSFDGKTEGSVHWVRNPDQIFDFLKKRINEKYSDYRIGIREQKEYWIGKSEYIGVDVKFTLFKETSDGKRQYKLLTIHDIDMTFLKLGCRLASMDKTYLEKPQTCHTMLDHVIRSKKDSGDQIRSLGQYNGFVVNLNDEEINSPDDAIVCYFKKLIEKENVISVGIREVGVLHDIDNVAVFFVVNFSM